MAQYINKKEVIDFLMQTKKQLLDEGHIDFYEIYDALLHFQQRISSKSAKVKAAEQGKWVGDRGGNRVYDDFRCSVCGHYSNTNNRSRLGNYCGNCGAEMDSGDDDKCSG